MNRLFRKSIAAVLSLVMLIGCFGTTALADEKTTDTTPEVVHEVTEIKYNDAVTFDDTVVLIENGNWSDGGERYEYLPEQQTGNVSLDTNLVFVDASGNQKVISNNNGGETLFDAVYPMISWDLTSAMCETIKVIKDGKMSFMKSDGSYFANNLTFYVDAYVLSDEAWLVSDDGTNYRAVNMKGETISDGYVNVENQYGYDTLQVGEIKDKIIIHTENSLHILDTNGKCLYTLKFENYAFASQYDDNHIYITSENVFIAVNYDGTVAYEIKENLRSFSASTKNGYGIAYFAVADENGDTTERYEVVDLTTGKVLLETTSYPMINGDLIILNNESTGKTELKAIDGTVYIEDVYGLYFEIANRMGFSGYKKGSMTIGQGALIISLQSAGETSEAKTVILKKEDSFSLEEAIIINGYNSGNYYMDSMECLFLYKDADSAMGPYYNMQYVYNVDGELIYDFTTDSEKSYSLWGSIYQDSVKRFDNESQTLSEVLCVVGVNDSQGQRIGYSILGKDGALSKVYTRINATTSGSYISAIDGDEVVVLDTNMDEVFRCKGDFIQVCSDKNNFIVSQEDTDYLYDANANLIYTGENTYIDANALSRYGSYCANEYDLSDYYDYCNLVLENGLCVVANVANDVSKFGVIKIGGTLDIKEDGLQYNESDGNWYYYVDGKVAVDYTGLVAHEGAWYYVASGVLDWGYTGLTYYYGTWYYVEGGILNWGYTGLTYYYGTWYYVEGGILNWGYTGLTYYYGTWYYVEGGILNWGYTGLTYYYGTWYYVEGGVLNWGYTGLTNYGGTWYYVEGGILNWGYTGLTYYYGTWYYVEGGVLNWGYTGLTCYGGTWYYVGNGILDWTFTGVVEYGGSLWYVENGIMICAA